jgi:hypothetical protein
MLAELNTPKGVKEPKKEKEQPRTQDLGELIAIFNTREDTDSDSDDSSDEDDIIDSEKNIIIEPSTKSEITDEDRNKLTELFNELCKKIECKACMKVFTTRTALQIHYDKNQECVKWNDLKIEQTDFISPPRGIHMWLYDILEQAVAASPEKSLQCKFCNTTFINKGNHHKHFNTSTVCNRLAFYELKNIIDKLIIHKQQ